MDKNLKYSPFLLPKINIIYFELSFLILYYKKIKLKKGTN